VTQREIEEIGKRIDTAVAGLRTEMVQQFGAVRAEMAEQGESLRAEMAEQGRGLRAEMAGQFAEVKAEIGELRTELSRVAIETRSIGIKVDELHGQIRIVGDGVALANERIDDVDLRIDKLTSEVRRNAAATRTDARRSTS
jgi:chromosome segregation ATPase